MLSSPGAYASPSPAGPGPGFVRFRERRGTLPAPSGSKTPRTPATSPAAAPERQDKEDAGDAGKRNEQAAAPRRQRASPEPRQRPRRCIKTGRRRNPMQGRGRGQAFRDRAQPCESPRSTPSFFEAGMSAISLPRFPLIFIATSRGVKPAWVIASRRARAAPTFAEAVARCGSVQPPRLPPLLSAMSPRSRDGRIRQPGAAAL